MAEQNLAQIGKMRDLKSCLCKLYFSALFCRFDIRKNKNLARHLFAFVVKLSVLFAYDYN